MKKYFFLLLLLIESLISFAQNTSRVFNPVSDQYKEFQTLSDTPNFQRTWMDTIKYPPNKYRSSIVYLLVKPYFL